MWIVFQLAPPLVLAGFQKACWQMEVTLWKQLVVLELLCSHDLWIMAAWQISDWLTALAGVKLQEGQMILEMQPSSQGHLSFLKRMPKGLSKLSNFVISQ